MKVFRWSELKNERLKKTRGASFEELLTGKIIDTIDHPSRNDQKIMLIQYKEYIWMIPHEETKDEIILKTLYKSRKYTKWCRERGIL